MKFSLKSIRQRAYGDDGRGPVSSRFRNCGNNRPRPAAIRNFEDQARQHHVNTTSWPKSPRRLHQAARLTNRSSRTARPARRQHIGSGDRVLESLQEYIKSAEFHEAMSRKYLMFWSDQAAITLRAKIWSKRAVGAQRSAPHLQLARPLTCGYPGLVLLEPISTIDVSVGPIRRELPDPPRYSV